MSFDSIFFLSCFMPLVLAVYWLIPGNRLKNWLLLILGLVFYAFGSFSGIVLLLGCALVNYLLGLLIRSGKAAKAAMAVGVTANLTFLIVYKYLDFVLAQVLGLPQLALGLAAPIGISFFVFKSISYLVDTYREPKQATVRFDDFLLYISFFPQVMAGPITRYADFGPQLRGRSCSAAKIANGLRRFIIGLAKKVILCGAIGAAVDSVYALEPAVLDWRLGWLGAIGYMLQIYYDFSGYSDMSIGLAAMLGFETPENFSYPYIAASIGEFWRRWHISLSTWFKDYLYIPLGGNRKGKARAALNKAIVFTLCGLWHGCGWTYLLWGAWHGLFSALESLGIIDPKAMAKSAVGKVIAHIYTLAVVCIGFVMFRAATVGEGLEILGAMFTGFSGGTAATVALHEILSTKVLAMLHAGMVLAMPIKGWLAKRQTLAKITEPVSYAVCLVLYGVCLAGLASGGFAPFIYFQF